MQSPFILTERRRFIATLALSAGAFTVRGAFAASRSIPAPKMGIPAAVRLSIVSKKPSKPQPLPL